VNLGGSTGVSTLSVRNSPWVLNPPEPNTNPLEHFVASVNDLFGHALQDEGNAVSEIITIRFIFITLHKGTVMDC
jgi:hypothetical protein